MMKNIILTLFLLSILSLRAEAYTYQWNVPYDNYGVVYPGNVQGGYYYGGKNAIVQPDNEYSDNHLKHKKQKHKKYNKKKHNKKRAG